MATTRPETAAEARERFFARYAPQVGSTWGDVQRYLGLRTPEPTTVEGWVVIAEAIIAKAAQPTPAPAALRFSFEVRAKVGDVEGPLTISGDRLQDVLKAVALLPQTPNLSLVEVARDWRTLPDGTPICPKHNVPMRKREKQGDEWYSHSTEINGKQCYCKGYAGKEDSPGWDA